MANIVGGAVVIGFTFGEPAISWPVVVTAVATWAGVLVFVLAVVEGQAMINALLFFAGILVVVWTIWLLDWFARRHDRKSGHGHV